MHLPMAVGSDGYPELWVFNVIFLALFFFSALAAGIMIILAVTNKQILKAHYNLFYVAGIFAALATVCYSLYVSLTLNWSFGFAWAAFALFITAFVVAFVGFLRLVFRSSAPQPEPIDPARDDVPTDTAVQVDELSSDTSDVSGDHDVTLPQAA